MKYQYTFVKCPSADRDMEKAVTALLNSGWKLAGPLVVRLYDVGAEFIQPMIREY